MHAILDFQLKKHESIIEKLSLQFKNADSDKNGLINEQELIEIIGNVLDFTQITEVLALLDPHNCQAITFSDFVLVATTFPVNNCKLIDLIN